MSTRTASVPGIHGAGDRVSTHREGVLMPQTVVASKPIALLSKEKRRLLEIIKHKSLLKGQFKLASGAMSDYYLDMKPTTFDPEGASLISLQSSSNCCAMIRMSIQSVGWSLARFR